MIKQGSLNLKDNDHVCGDQARVRMTTLTTPITAMAHDYT
jgi:hypothetical protein